MHTGRSQLQVSTPRPTTHTHFTSLPTAYTHSTSYNIHSLHIPQHTHFTSNNIHSLHNPQHTLTPHARTHTLQNIHTHTNCLNIPSMVVNTVQVNRVKYSLIVITVLIKLIMLTKKIVIRFLNKHFFIFTYQSPFF